MNLITGLLRSLKQHDSIWVIVNRMTKSTHFLPVQTTHLEEDFSMIYIQDVVKLDGVLVAINSGGGTQFTTQFLKSIRRFGSKVNLSTVFHPQTYGLA